MDDFPGSVNPSEQVGSVTSVVDFPAVPSCQLYLGVHDRPRELAFKVRLDTGESQAKAQFCFRLYVILNQITETPILSATFEVASSVPVKKVAVERVSVPVLPSKTDVLKDFLNQSRVVICFNDFCAVVIVFLSQDGSGVEGPEQER